MWAYTSIGRGGWAFPVDKCELIEGFLEKALNYGGETQNEPETEARRGRERRGEVVMLQMRVDEAGRCQSCGRTVRHDYTGWTGVNGDFVPLRMTCGQIVLLLSGDGDRRRQWC